MNDPKDVYSRETLFVVVIHSIETSKFFGQRQHLLTTKFSNLIVQSVHDNDGCSARRCGRDVGM